MFVGEVEEAAGGEKVSPPAAHVFDDVHDTLSLTALAFLIYRIFPTLWTLVGL